MRPDRDPPPGVAERLAALRALCVPELDAEARARLDKDRPRINENFAVAVDRRLRELRALCELARHLQRARPDPGRSL